MEAARAGNALGRRGLIAGAAALVAGIAAKQTSQPVAAAGTVMLGIQGNVATAMTTVINDAATATAGPALYGYRTTTAVGSAANFTDAGIIGATDIANADGVLGDVTNAGGSAKGVHGLAGAGYGVYGNVIFGGTGTGVGGYGGSGPGVSGTSMSGYGVVGQGGLAPLRLMPVFSGIGAPTTGTHAAGELYVDQPGSLFYCKEAGTPGTWINLSTPATTTAGVSGIATPGGTATGAVSLVAGSNVTITEAGNTITIASAGSSGVGPQLTFLPTPERFVDTRANLGGLQGPVAANTTHTFPMTGRSGLSGNAALQVPDTATAIVGNLTVIGAAGIPLGSFLTVWPGGTQPTVSNINFGPATVTGAVANSFAVALTSVGGHGSLNVFNLSACDYILDVTGYYK